MRFACPSSATSVLKTEFFIPISADEKGATSGFRVLTNHLASFFFLTLSGDSFGFHSDLDSLLPINRQVEELTYIPNSSFNGQSLMSVNSNTKGYWEIDHTSLLSVVDHVTKCFFFFCLVALVDRLYVVSCSPLVPERKTTDSNFL